MKGTQSKVKVSSLLKDSYRFEENGWIYIYIKGTPFQRGFQHGFLLAREIENMLGTIKYIIEQSTARNFNFFSNAAEKMFFLKMDKEFVDEIRGIAAGARRAGVNLTYKDILTLNSCSELINYWWPAVEDIYPLSSIVRLGQGSSFIASGDATIDGSIVMGHNTWDNFVIGQLYNIIIDIKPSSGHRMIMQSAPGYISSPSDFFITDAGIIGSGSIICGSVKYKPNNIPQFCKVRKAIQYAENINQWTDIIKKQNIAAYPTSWLLGDLKTNEIAKFERGISCFSLEKKRNGCFTGFNIALDHNIRNLECKGYNLSDIRQSGTARMTRWEQLIKKSQYYGKIDVEMAKIILADHYDVYLNNEKNPCSRTICGHYEFDPCHMMSIHESPEPYKPYGTVDGKVLDSTLAKEMKFWARSGSSCGTPFSASEFLSKHPQWNWQEKYLKDRPSKPWTLFEVGKQKPEAPN